MSINKSRFKDPGGRYLTQSLFIDFNYNTEFAVYTLEEEDKLYKGVNYPSLKRLFLEEEDPTEYRFAKKYLCNWSHWQRMNGNAALKKHFDEWRDELEVYLRSQGLRSLIDMSEDNVQAAKYLAEKGWDRRGVGRPSKAEEARENRIRDSMADYAGHVIRLGDYKT